MKHRSAVRLAVLAMLVPLASCWHTDPIGYDAYGPEGPEHPGLESRLALTGTAVEWVGDGRGIVYVGSRCMTRAPLESIPSMRMLPSSGGSATWERCESVNSYRRPLDSLESFGSVAMDAAGRLLYTVCTWPNSPDLNCRNFGHVQLWLSDSGAPYTRRRRLADLYHVVLGAPSDPAGQLNNIADIHWAGANTFVARGLYTHRTFGDATLGLVLGQIDSAGVSLVVVPNTANVQDWALASSSRVVVRRGGLALEEITIPGGVASPIVDIPSLPGRGIAAISCRGSTCLVVTNDVGGPSIFWQVGLTTRQVVQLATHSGSVSFAALSPSSDAVVFGRGSTYYLIENVGLNPAVH